MAEKNKLERHFKIYDIAPRVKEKLERVLSVINTKGRGLSKGNEPQERLVDRGEDDEDEKSVSTQILFAQKLNYLSFSNILIDILTLCLFSASIVPNMNWIW